MNNTEFIEKYLTNRLSEEEKIAFENQLANDPTLKADLELQTEIINSIRKAKANELKSVLNQISVDSSGFLSFSVLRMAVSIVGIGIVIFLFSYYFNHTTKRPNLSTSLKESIQNVDPRPNLNL